MHIELVIARGYAPELLEAAEKPLDEVTLGVAGGVIGPRVRALTPGRNHGAGAAGNQGCPNGSAS